MTDQRITCPNCGHNFGVGDVLTETIRTQLRGELEADVLKKQEAATKRLKEAEQREKALAEREENVAATVAERLEAERKKLAAAERVKAEKELRGQIADLQEQLDERSRKLQDAAKQEAKLLRRQRELQEKEEAMGLELERRLDEERKTLVADAMKRVQEAQELKMREKEDLVVSLRKQIGDLQRKMEQGSQERQGEALEGLLQHRLSNAFPFDTFEEVRRGVRGADIVQTVRTRQGVECGKILWEAKNTRHFSRAWIGRLKEDQRNAGAAVAVLMTVAMPPDIKQFGQLKDGSIWVTEYGCAVGLCTALRQQLLLVAREKRLVEHRDTVKDSIYEYVTGPEFARRVSAVVETYIQMQQDLESEKRAFQRVWKRREKQIDIVLENVAGMRGELEAVAGNRAALPDVGPLSLDQLAPEEEEEDDETEFEPDEAEYEDVEDVEDDADDEEAEDSEDAADEELDEEDENQVDDDEKDATVAEEEFEDEPEEEPRDTSAMWWLKRRGAGRNTRLVP